MPTSNSAAFPAPGPIELEHSLRLRRTIAAAAREAGGALPFSEFMALALYAPGLGYYAGGSTKLGPSGDFVTAPELTPLFAQCLSRQVSDVLQALGGGDLLELGAGSGALIVDLLASLAELDSLPTRYLVLEPSPELRARQRARVADLPDDWVRRIEWLEKLPSIPIDGVVIANEVLDAMPVERFRLCDRRIYEQTVVCPDDGDFSWAERPACDALVSKVRAVETALGRTLGDGYVSELNPVIVPWIQSVSDVLASGVIFMADYGYPRHEYYHRQRSGGTLICHYRHRAHEDPLRLVGLQDISASVDFTALAEAGIAAGLDLCGYTSQSWFLLGCGLDEILASSSGRDAKQQLRLTAAAKHLLLPGRMGERFKVIAFGRRAIRELRGFRLEDQRHRLCQPV